jgi:transcription-repair coupling factor (superfamily II helicase)
MGELGSGFLLATHDLEIRGAGELLGEEQSGQIEEVGFTLYADLLAEAVSSIKSGALQDRPFGASACEVDLGASALLPDDYIPDVHTRLVLYKRLAEAADEPALEELQVEMVDRFSLLPEPAQRLVEATRVRIQAQALGVSKLRAGARGITLDFVPQPAVDARKLIRLIQAEPRIYRLEGQSRLQFQAALTEQSARAPAALGLLATLSART